MPTMYGADVAQLRALAAQFERTADHLERGRMAVGSAIRISAWFGPFATSFRLEWDSQHSLRIARAAQLLRENALLARANADEQERTSAIDGSSGAPGSGRPSGEDSDGGWQDWFGDRLGDLKNAGDAGVDWVGDRGADLWHGGEAAVDWMGDRAVDAWNVGTDAVDWTGDRLGDAWNWAGDRAEAIGDDWANAGESGLQYWNATGGSLLDGRWPRTTEVVASALLVGGATLGAIVTTSTGGIVETNVFDDGDPDIGPAQRVFQPRPPSELSSLTTSVTDAYDAGDGVVRVTTVDTPDGPRVIVSVPGTESWNPLSGDNPMDLAGNVVTAGGGRSTMTEGVELALKEANIPLGTPMMLVGHSQGGMTVADLASDPAFVDRFNVTNAITFASPVDSNHFDPRVSVLELQHASDVVPRLDMGDSLYTPNPMTPAVPILPGMASGYEQSGPQHTTVTLPNPGSAFDAAGNHSHENYSASIAASQDPGLLAYEQQLRVAGFLSGQVSNTSAVDIHVGRQN